MIDLPLPIDTLFQNSLLIDFQDIKISLNEFYNQAMSPKSKAMWEKLKEQGF